MSKSWSGDVLVIGDAHDSPKLDKDRFYWAGRFARDNKIQKIIQIGDFFTFDSLCSYEANDTIRGKYKPSFQDDVESGREALLALQRGLRGYSSLHCTLGNHEDRTESWQNRNPEMAGLLTGAIKRMFKDHGWSTTPYGQVQFIGRTGFVHIPLNGLSKPYGGKTAMSRIASDTVHDIVYGHTHKGGWLSCPKIGTNKRVVVVDVACYLPEGHVERYIGHGQSGWQYGLTTVRLHKGRIERTNFTTVRELEDKYG